MCDYSNPFPARLTTANLIKRFSGHRGSPTLAGLKTPAVSIPTALPVHRDLQHKTETAQSFASHCISKLFWASGLKINK